MKRPDIYFDAKFDVDKLLKSENREFVNLIRSVYSGIHFELRKYRELKTMCKQLINQIEEKDVFDLSKDKSDAV